MKKIAILTLQKSHNCGSIMQAFALQEVLKKIGETPEFVDFGTEQQIEEYGLYTSQKGIKGLIKNTIYFINRKILKRHWNDYDLFRKRNLNLSSMKFNESSDFSLIDNKYDKFITGSDQVWNVTIPDYNDIYFLPFENKRKMAYAASFGARDPRKFADCTNIKKLLGDFDYISIRENSGKNILKEWLNQDVDVVLDPTLLLEAKDYEIIEGETGITSDKKYIFYYATIHSKELDIFVKKVADKNNLEVISWNSKEYHKKFVWRYGFKQTFHQDPGVYLSLIKNASMVITTSFHGTIFSSIYRKNFWSLKNGDMFKNDDRVITMMKNLGLENRLIIPDFDENFDYLSLCDYTEYENNIYALRENSMKFLEQIKL